ncbi:hypothetical protein CYY_009875 [Polysphondylium violaceum]|uniref:Uncharacterized protein n=1 Tax=Polysphondylium violaceum TaxID=133409 RepID=A0A8J4UVM2_9MYCE|nr:hypothetical protein CYY_009875 [Polysphondylium violaceum]
MNRNIIRVGSGAGYQGDRVPPAIALVENGNLDYLILECLAERTLTDSIKRMKNNGKGYDPRLKEWLTALLPITTKKKVTIISNMGAADPKGAGEEAIEIAEALGIKLRIVVVSENNYSSSNHNTPTTTTHILHTNNYNSNSNKKDKEKEKKKLIAVSSNNGFAVDSEADSNVEETNDWEVGCTYLGADAIIDALKIGADLVIAGRVADPSLFVAPIAYSFNWDLKKDYNLIAQATLAGHVLECGCHLTGGYFAHPLGRDMDFKQLLNLSLPFCDIDSNGNIILGKVQGSGGELSERTCKQQLTYEIGNPREYITPDIIVDFSKVEFISLSENSVLARGATGYKRPDTLLRLVARNAGFKSWAEVSYGGLGCVERAQWAYRLIYEWMESRKKGIMKNVVVYLVGYNSLYLPHGSNFNSLPSKVEHLNNSNNNNSNNSCNDLFNLNSQYPPEVRLRIDGLFESREDAEALGMELQGLGLCGPAGGGGFAFGIKKDVRLVKQLIPREKISWSTFVFSNHTAFVSDTLKLYQKPTKLIKNLDLSSIQTLDKEFLTIKNNNSIYYNINTTSNGQQYQLVNRKGTIINSSRGDKVLLYNIAHSRSGDKGDTANVSLIPYDVKDYDRLKKIITKEWVYSVYKNLLKSHHQNDSDLVTKTQIHIYEMPGISSLNIVMNYALDGGVCVSRRIDRHGKTLSDLILNQWVDLPLISNL